MTALKFAPLFCLGLALAAPARADDITLDCLAQPAKTVAVASSVTGLISDVLVGRGDKVTKGQVIAKLDDTVEQGNVMVAKAQAEGDELIKADQSKLDLAKGNLERSQQLVKSGSVTASKVQELQAAVVVAQSDLDTDIRRQHLAQIELQRQEALLGLQTIKSPINGSVTEQKLQVGEFVQQQSSVFTIVQTDPLYIETYVPTDLWGKVTIKSTGTVALDQPAGTRLPAKVTVVDPIFDAASGTFGVRLELSNADQAIPAGQRCQVTLTTPDAPAK